MHDTASHLDFGKEIIEDIAANRIQLPTLPEVALKVRDAVENETASAPQLAEIVSGDPALSARLLQVANSPLYRGRVPIDNIQMAITRMGLNLVKSLVVSLAMKQIFQATSETLDRQFRKVWEESIEVAAISRVLAGSVDGLEKEQAMLAGLIHNIGALPILTKLDHSLGYDTDPCLMSTLIRELAPKIGNQILKHWNFSDSFLQIPEQCLQLDRDSAQADYADIVLVARLEHLAASGDKDTLNSMDQWSQYPAFAKIGMETEVIVLDIEGPAEEIAEVRNMFSA